MLLPVQTQEPEPASPSAREIYVACSLHIREVGLIHARPNPESTFWIDSAGCYWTAVRALSLHTGDRTTGAGSNRTPSFCPPESLNVSVHDVRPLAAEYLIYFERHAAEVAERPAFPVFLRAMIERWPCR
jgi:hypothetical protein